jgi:hypothetical protein
MIARRWIVVLLIAGWIGVFRLAFWQRDILRRVEAECLRAARAAKDASDSLRLVLSNDGCWAPIARAARHLGSPAPETE